MFPYGLLFRTQKYILNLFYLLLRIVFSTVLMFEPQSVHHTEVKYGHKRSREDCQTKPIKTVGLADPLSWPRVDAVIPVFVISSVHERWNHENNPKNPRTNNYHLFWYQAKQRSNYGKAILWSTHKSAYQQLASYFYLSANGLALHVYLPLDWISILDQ